MISQLDSPTAIPIVAQPALGSVTLDQFRALVADLRREYPQANGRLDHGAFIATFRTVEQGMNPGIYWVDSETDPNQQYLVRLHAGEAPTCTCRDFAIRGDLTPCKHQFAVMLCQRAERREAEAQDPTLRPIEYALTPRALAQLDDHRQRMAARCPDCNAFKQHGDLYCGGHHCTQTSGVQA